MQRNQSESNSPLVNKSNTYRKTEQVYSVANRYHSFRRKYQRQKALMCIQNNQKLHRKRR
jgi:hypothetical protein